jgi:dephospho-CoA kinase
MNAMITALVGLCGTGKSVVAQCIETQYRFCPIYFGGFVLAEVKRRHLEINSNNEKIVREDLRAQHGIEVMAKLAEPEINAALAEGKHVSIDGLYSFSEYTYLKQKYGEKLILIAVHSSKRLRYQRLGIRQVRPLTPRQVDERDYFEIKNIEKAGPIAIADYHILNNGTIPELEQQINTIFKELLGQS